MKRKNIIIFIFFIFISLVIFVNQLFNYISEEIQKIDRNSIDNSINVKRAYQIFMLEKNLTIIDVRAKKFYLKSHIKNAISVPYLQMDLKNSIYNIQDKNTLIITYCDSKLCSLSDLAAKKLKTNGYINTFYLKGGIEEWTRHGYPVVTSQ